LRSVESTRGGRTAGGVLGHGRKKRLLAAVALTAMAAAAWLAFGLHMAQPAHAAGRTTWMCSTLSPGE
jgi:hypothetical protein